MRTLAVLVLIGLTAAGEGRAQGGSRFRTTMFHGVELPYEVVDGWAIHGGDIILGTAEDAAARAPRSGLDVPASPRVPRLAPYPSEVLWPGGIVPYVIDDDVPHPEWIVEAIGIWNEKTVLQFVERTTEPDYLRFAVRDAGCFGVFGRGFDGGERIMPVEPRGCPVPITLHELGHAIGMWHEQQRQDRDRYVKVFRENIDPGDWGRGQWHPHEHAGPDIGPYDYRSVMHYGFSSDDLRRHGHILMADTIPPGMPMGQTVELSPGDIDSVARLYGHVPTEHVVSTNPAGLEIIVDGVRMTAPASFDWGTGSEHTLEVPSPQYREGARFLFGRWSDDGSRAHTVTATRDTTLFQASFVAQYQVATTTSPGPHAGTVTFRPAPDAGGYHTLRTPIELIATPARDSSHRFLNWEVETDYWWDKIPRRSYGEASNPARTFVKAGMVARARFVEGPIFRVESNVEAVPVVVRGRERIAPVAYPAGELPGTTTVTASPIDDGRRSYRHRFLGWSNGGDISHVAEVPADEDSTLSLRLATDYRLSTTAWYGHEIETVPSSEDGFYPEGTVVRLLAVEEPPEEFIGWSGGDVSGPDPAALVTMDTGRYAEAVFAAGTSEILPEEPVDVSLRWRAGESDHDRRYVRVPPGTRELRIQFHTRAVSDGAEAGLFVTPHRDPWPWDVGQTEADRVLRGGIETIAVSPARDGWPAAYFILVRGVEGVGIRTLAGTLVASAAGASNRAPQAVGTLEDRTLSVRGGALVMDVARAFTDPDGDALMYQATSSAPSVAAVAIFGSTVTVTPLAAGLATITVTAMDIGRSSAVQQFAVTVMTRRPFTDHPLGRGTPIRAVHFRELRERIAALRAREGLPVVGWTDPTLVAGVTRVRRAHLTELRLALDAVFEAAGRPGPAYTDAVLAAGVLPIRAVHIRELRNAILVMESEAGSAP